MTDENTRLYLEKIEISNFRAYGADFTLNLPNGPGMTIVYGPNGVGKTTLFDAVEWCLTGKVSRFEHYPSTPGSRRIQYLTRMGAAEGSHRVSLSFTGLNAIDRGQGFEPDLGDIDRVLRQPGWPDVSDLSRYLSITHFLGQSASQRISVKLPKDQWEALKGPTGIERVNQIKDRIGGNTTRKAFTRYIGQLEGALASRKKEKDEWEDLMERLVRLRGLSNSADALSPAAVIEVCEQTLRSIENLGLADVPTRTADISPESALGQARVAIGIAEKSLQTRSTQLHSLEGLTEEFASLRHEAKAAMDQAEAAESQRATSDVLANAVLDRLSEARVRQEAAIRQKTTAEYRLAANVRIAESLALLNHSTARLSAIEVELPPLMERIRAAEAEEAELTASISEAQLRMAQREALAETIRHLTAAAPLVREREILRSEVRGGEAASDVHQELARLQEQRTAVDLQVLDAREKVEAFERALEAHDRRNATIAAAVAQLAAVLTSDDIECPVCATRFQQGELLKSLSRERSGSEANARELGESLVASRAELATVTALLADLAQQVQVQTKRLEYLEISARRAQELEVQIVAVAGGQRIETTSDLDVTVSKLTSHLKSLDNLAGATRSQNELQSRIQEVRVHLSTTSESLETLRREQAELLGKEQNARSTLEQFPDLWEPDSGLKLSLDEHRAAAADEVTSATNLVRECSEAVDVLNKQLELRRRAEAEAAATRDASQARGEELARRRATLVTTWRTLGMEEEPDLQVVWAERDRIGQVAQSLKAAQDDLERAHRQYRNWMADEGLVAYQADVKRRLQVANVADEQEMSETLHRAVLDSEQLLGRAQRTKQRVDEVVGNLKEIASTYAQDVLDPLNETIQAYASVLLTRADGSMLFRSEHHVHRSELRPGIIRTDALGRSESLDLNPNFFFSEGQLSALSVSAVLAASTTFRWSRWPALLLDDPLQHNDVIHASAFIDLLRRMVDELRYQVILSSHDSSEADFIARKCRSAGIPYSVCELLPTGDAGIVSNAVDLLP